MTTPVRLDVTAALQKHPLARVAPRRKGGPGPGEPRSSRQLRARRHVRQRQSRHGGVVSDRVGWHFCEPRDPRAKGCVERLQDFLEKSFEPGRRFANELDFQLQRDAWFDTRANPRVHKTLRCRPIDRLTEERAVMASLPATPPETDRRWLLGFRRTRICASTPATTR